MVNQKLTDFKLNAFYDYVPIISRSWETGVAFAGILPWIDAKVPGCIYSDLLRAGLIRDPYYDMQSLECEWVKDRWWVYQTKFLLSSNAKHFRLTCKGIDYKARIGFNGQLIGEHEGMYVPFRADITSLVKAGEENELVVTLEHAPDEMGQIGYTEKTWTQKARFCYHWDWCPRMVHLGLYDDVLIEEFGDASIDERNIQPVKTGDGWALDCTLGITGYASCDATIGYVLSKDGQVVASADNKLSLKEGSQQVHCRLGVGLRRLWYPNGHGPQPLYDVTITLTDGDGVSDQVSQQVGFRTLEYRRCDGAPEDALSYLPVINGKKIYIKGSNFVPADMMYGALTKEDYRSVLEKAKEAHINLLRVWGGGLIEKEDFYDLCDEYGIMVMQEFIQSSSGVSNEPSVDPHFLELCRATAQEATRTRRNHVSLTFWTGGNELFTDEGPVDFEHPTIRMLKDITHQNNPEVLMLPASPSGKRKGRGSDYQDSDYQGPDHDIHDEWKYGGPVNHYTRYNTADCMLHSEFGVDGMANLDTLRQAVSPAHQKVVFFNDDPVLRHHGEACGTPSGATPSCSVPLPPTSSKPLSPAASSSRGRESATLWRPTAAANSKTAAASPGSSTSRGPTSRAPTSSTITAVPSWPTGCCGTLTVRAISRCATTSCCGKRRRSTARRFCLQRPGASALLYAGGHGVRRRGKHRLRADRYGQRRRKHLGSNW